MAESGWAEKPGDGIIAVRINPKKIKRQYLLLFIASPLELKLISFVLNLAGYSAWPPV